MPRIIAIALAFLSLLSVQSSAQETLTAAKEMHFPSKEKVFVINIQRMAIPMESNQLFPTAVEKIMKLQPPESIKLMGGETAVLDKASQTFEKIPFDVNSLSITPVLGVVIDEVMVKELLADFNAGKKSVVVDSPTITLPSGETGVVHDGSARPIVGGLSRVKGSLTQPDQFEPIIKLVREGVEIEVVATDKGQNGEADLKLVMQASQIQAIQEIPLPTSSDEKLKIQRPIVTTERYTLATAIPLGKTILCDFGVTESSMEMTIGVPVSLAKKTFKAIKPKPTKKWNGLLVTVHELQKDQK